MIPFTKENLATLLWYIPGLSKKTIRTEDVMVMSNPDYTRYKNMLIPLSVNQALAKSTSSQNSDLFIRVSRLKISDIDYSGRDRFKVFMEGILEKGSDADGMYIEISGDIYKWFNKDTWKSIQNRNLIFVKVDEEYIRYDPSNEAFINKSLLKLIMVLILT